MAFTNAGGETKTLEAKQNGEKRWATNGRAWDPPIDVLDRSACARLQEGAHLHRDHGIGDVHGAPRRAQRLEPRDGQHVPKAQQREVEGGPPQPAKAHPRGSSIPTSGGLVFFSSSFCYGSPLKLLGLLLASFKPTIRKGLPILRQTHVQTTALTCTEKDRLLFCSNPSWAKQRPGPAHGINKHTGVPVVKDTPRMCDPFCKQSSSVFACRKHSFWFHPARMPVKPSSPFIFRVPGSKKSRGTL